jgi:fructose-1,6-bisphosphatase
MLIRILTALLYAAQGWQKARQTERMVGELRYLSRGRVYHYPGEVRTRERLTKLYEGQE